MYCWWCSRLVNDCIVSISTLSCIAFSLVFTQKICIESIRSFLYLCSLIPLNSYFLWCLIKLPEISFLESLHIAPWIISSCRCRLNRKMVEETKTMQFRFLPILCSIFLQERIIINWLVLVISYNPTTNFLLQEIELPCNNERHIHCYFIPSFSINCN